jgi:transposase
MRFVTPKSQDQQAMLAWHRAKSGFVEERTALLNRIRGLLAEFGIWIGRSSSALVRHLPELADDERLPPQFRPIVLHALEHLRHINERIDECDDRIRAHAEGNEDAQRAQQLCGIGPQIASALVATISNPQDFRNGRQMAAWAGLVPRQFSTGGKTVLGSITKRGDSYLRGLLTQGARSAVQSALKRKPEQRSHLEQWIVTLHGRVGYHKTLVAIANKYLRILWAILARKEDFDARAWLRHAEKA